MRPAVTRGCPCGGDEEGSIGGAYAVSSSASRKVIAMHMMVSPVIPDHGPCHLRSATARSGPSLSAEHLLEVSARSADRRGILFAAEFNEIRTELGVLGVFAGTASLKICRA